MKVKLINYSQPAHKDMDAFKLPADMIAFAARVSNPSNQWSENNDKLLNYLIEHQHWSPFEMVSACIEVETTRDIARQFLRHRSFSFQEFSQRYADPTSDLGFEAREARLQDSKNRQNSIDVDNKNLQIQWVMKQKQIIHESKLAYQWAIDNGIAKEQARAVLPEGNTVSKLYANGTFRSWIHYCHERTKESTQKEHRLLAKEIVKVLGDIFPYITK